jgi:predicted site-specific integrase-resolvase
MRVPKSTFAASTQPEQPVSVFGMLAITQMVGVSENTIRRWDEQGLIRLARDSGNRRIATAADIQLMRFLKGRRRERA